MKKKLFGSISYVMLIMVFSRILSLVSTQVYMSHFGVKGVEIGVYSYAISVPNIIFNCFGTALSTVVIPIYAGYIVNKQREKAKSFADNIITISFVLSLAFVAIGIALSPLLPMLTQFGKDPAASAFCTKALMIIMPVMIFYGLNYIFQGMLQSEGHFGWPSFVSVPSSLVVILYVFLLSDKYGVTGLLVATLIGLSMQALILIPPLYKAGYRYKPSFRIKDPDIINAGKMTIPVLLGASSYQLNMFYNVTMIANFEGMVTLLTFVQNLVLNVVLAFIYSITAVIYPKLTEFAATNRFDEYKQTLNSIINSVLLLLIPITFGLISVSGDLLGLITKWGKIDSDDIHAATLLMIMYSIGITGIGLKEILDRAFYALKNTKISAINGFVIMTINIVLSLVFMRFIGPYGIPLAYSIASLTGAVILVVMLCKKVGGFLNNTLSTALKSLVSSIVMSICVLLLSSHLTAVLDDTILSRVIKLFVPVFVGVVIYGVLLVVLKVPQITDIICKIKTKFGRGHA